MARHEQSGNGRIIFKLNSIVDEQLIDALYRASQAGVQVDIWVRGICALRPGVAGPEPRTSRSAPSWAGSSSTPGCSGSAATASRSVYIGSADMMHRNLDRRVEALRADHRAAARRATITSLLEQGDRGLDVALGPGRRTAAGPATTSTPTGEPLTDLQTAIDRDPPQAAPQGAASLGTTPTAS